MAEYYTSGQRVISRNPSPVFDKVTGRSYSLWYLFQLPIDELVDELDDICRVPSEPDRRLFVQVRHGDHLITTVEFACGLTPFCQNIEVPIEHRQRGIANAIYLFAEKLLGRVLYNFWADNTEPWQSPLGLALWSQRSRPFGPQRFTGDSLPTS